MWLTFFFFLFFLFFLFWGIIQKKCRWFHGYLTKDEAQARLSVHGPGSFLVRFSQSKPGNFAVAFVGRDGATFHIQIKPCKQGLTIITKEGADVFDDLQSVVLRYSDFLLYPLSVASEYEHLLGKRIDICLKEI